MLADEVVRKLILTSDESQQLYRAACELDGLCLRNFGIGKGESFKIK